jgi:hypothetical protein
LKKKKKNPERKKTYPEFNRFEKYSINYQKKTNKQTIFLSKLLIFPWCRKREREKEKRR